MTKKKIKVVKAAKVDAIDTIAEQLKAQRSKGIREVTLTCGSIAGVFKL